MLRSFSIRKLGISNVMRTAARELSNRPRPPFTAGQPLHETRPFMLKPGDLTPGITALEYFERRIVLASKLPANSAAVVVGNSVQFASGSVFYDFQQNNDLYYLSGWNEPDSCIIIEKPNDNPNDVVFHMIVPPKDKHSEQWDGARTGVVGARDIFNADEVGDTHRIGIYLKEVLERNHNIFIDLPEKKKRQTTAATFSDFFSIGANSKYSTVENVLSSLSGKNILPLKKFTSQMRLIKSPAELAIMRKAGQISGRAYNQAYAKRFRTERTLKSYLEYKFISGGADKSAYIPVIAGGENALCIHYTRNDDTLYDDEMVLVDAAGSLGGYCADISRTWPVSGKFSEPQRDLYQAVLNVEKSCIKLCKESEGLSLQRIHDASITFFKTELKNLGFGPLNSHQISKIYPHYIGHNLGLDVHDVPESSRFEPIKEGQVITIEPGLYIPADDYDFPAHFRGIGIRVEDDIAVGKDTFRNLTVEAAKEIADIEHIAEHGVTTPYEDEILEVL